MLSSASRAVSTGLLLWTPLHIVQKIIGDFPLYFNFLMITKEADLFDISKIEIWPISNHQDPVIETTLQWFNIWWLAKSRPLVCWDTCPTP